MQQGGGVCRCGGWRGVSTNLHHPSFLSVGGASVRYTLADFDSFHYVKFTCPDQNTGTSLHLNLVSCLTFVLSAHPTQDSFLRITRRLSTNTGAQRFSGTFQTRFLY